MSKDIAIDNAIENSFRFDSIILVVSNGSDQYSLLLEEEFTEDSGDIVERYYGGERIVL